jgi:purine-nucleoside phosphorylase
VIATASVPLDGTTRAYLDGEPYAPVADFATVSALVQAANAAGAVHHVGLIATGDALYAESVDHAARWAARGVLAFEMEASALFTIAALRGARAACILLITNTAGTRDWLEGGDYAKAERQLLRVALDATASLA